MTEEPQEVSEDTGSPESVEPEQQVMVGLHPLGGIRLFAPDVRLSPSEAFNLAGQLTAHATIMINLAYAQQAQQQAEADALIERVRASGIKMPPGVR